MEQFITSCSNNIRVKKIAIAAFLFTMMLTATDVFADFVKPVSNYQVHGFLTQGFVKTSDNNFFGDSENGSFEFTELGINISAPLTQKIFASAQLISRTTGAFYDGKPQIDYAMLDFNLVNAENWLGGLRIGRMKNPYGLYNDGRDAAVTRNGILLPQSLYFDKARNTVLHGDGLQFYADINMDESDLFIQSNYGYTEMGENVEYAYLGVDFPGKMKKDDPLWVTRLLYEYQGGLIRLAYSKAIGNTEYVPGVVDLLSSGGVEFDLDVVSFEFNQEHWSITAEYMQQWIEWNGLSPAFEVNDHTAEGYYLQGTFRPSDDVELFLRYDVSHLNRDDKDGIKASMRTGRPAHIQFTHDWTIGVRWDITQELMLRAEYHDIEGTSWLSAQETPFAEMKKDWQMFNLLLSYHF